MIASSRSRLLLVIATLALVAGVIVPAGAGGASETAIQTDITPSKAPWISRFYLAAGPTTGGDLVKIFGHHFTGVTTVRFGGVRATNLAILSDTQITVTTPAHSPGRFRVRVISPAGSSPRNFGYEFIPPPEITSVSPAVGPLGGGTPVTVTGTGFTYAAFARFGGVDGTDLHVVDDTTLTVVTPAHAAGDVRVRVGRVTGSSPRSSAARFSYLPPPTISSKSPPNGPPSGGTSVTITGTSFTGTGAVYFDGIAASFTVNSDTQIVAISPPHASGFVAVTIVTSHGTVVDPADTYPFIYD